MNGWNVYDAVEEYKRMGLDNESWTISRINEKYALCDTYPQILGLPSGITVSWSELTHKRRCYFDLVDDALQNKTKIEIILWIVYALKYYLKSEHLSHFPPYSFNVVVIYGIFRGVYFE